MTQYSFTVANNQLIHAEQPDVQWACLYQSYLGYFQQQKAQRWVLYEVDCYHFSALFLALLAAGKQVVLPQNGQKGHLEQVMAVADAFADSVSLAGIQWSETSEAEVTVTVPSEGQITLFTSGSSGTPKQIYKQVRQLFTEVEALEQQFNEDVVGTTTVATVSHQHVYGLLFKLLWPLANGRALVCKSFEYPEHIGHYLAQHAEQQINLISSPAHLHRLFEDNVLMPWATQLQMLYSSGGPLDMAKNLSLQKQLCTPITEVYGSTETGGIAWRKLISTDDLSWTPFDTIEIRVEQEQRLAIRSPYLDVVDQWYLTDDRVEVSPAGCFKLLGRVDRVVKLEEKRLSLDELQAKLQLHPWVKESYVLIMGDGTKKLAAVVALNDDGQAYLADNKKLNLNRALREHLLNWFEPVLLPKKFRYLEQMPCNSQGKINRAELEALFV